MCSTAAQRIAEIGRAIDDLAVSQATPAVGDPEVGDTAVGDTDPIVARLAELWGLLAELDPEVGRRLAGYQNLSAPTDLWLAVSSHLTGGRDRPSQPPTGPSLRPHSAGTARPSPTT